MLFDSLPSKLNIVRADSIDYFAPKIRQGEKYDIFISNPPYIRSEEQTPEVRLKLASFLRDLDTGKADTYYAFIKIAVESLKEGGFGLFVLPHSFLINKGAAKIRKLISENAWIRFWADLSEINVFDASIYITLIIFQKKKSSVSVEPKATVLKCRNQVGKALQQVLNNNLVNSKFYNIYQVDQSIFENSEWYALPPLDYQLKDKISQNPPVEAFLDVKQGLITGADDIFIRSKDQIPKEEMGIYRMYLPDREMQAYTVPKKSDLYVFYPYVDGQKISSSDLEQKYKKTWEYLLKHQSKLSRRKSVGANWWSPSRPRKPEDILQPKIVTPHLTVTPRFSLDIEGKYCVSHTAYLKTKDPNVDQSILFYFLGVLNSTVCYWYISKHSHKYGQNYSMMEVKTLKKTPIPDPSRIDKTDFLNLTRLVKKRYSLTSNYDYELEMQIELLVCKIFKLNDEEIKHLFGGII